VNPLSILIRKVAAAAASAFAQATDFADDYADTATVPTLSASVPPIACGIGIALLLDEYLANS
jgi:hypothetical protein